MAKFNPQKELNIDDIIEVITGRNRHFPLDIAIDIFIKSSYSEKERLLGILLENNELPQEAVDMIRDILDKIMDK